MGGAERSWVHEYWGKAHPDKNYSTQLYHPLAWHMLDVAAVAEALLGTRPILSSHVSGMLGLDCKQTRSLLTWVAAMHDCGKFARAFQCKVAELWPARVPLDSFNSRTRHDADGRRLWDAWLEDEPALPDRIWPGASGSMLASLLDASVCHHGEPVEASMISLRHDFGPGALAATACRDALLELLLPHPMDARAPGRAQIQRASHWIAGLVTVADWIGSSQRWFPYVSANIELADYWDRARENADRAVHEAGLCTARPRIGAGFSELTGKASEPTPLQAWALAVQLLPGPMLFILEDVTGAGKTEAAHLLVHRLMADGRASGAWWAMPTMATANAMYARQADMLAGLFDPHGPRPSLALSHGQTRLHSAFQASRAEWGASEAPLGDGGDGLTASAACAAFLADDRRLSLLADVGAGTIDQAVLSVLPSRFNTVRLLGLAEKMLVVDEVHAHDAYVTEELLALLEFHRAQGGSAILLSATLSNRQRDKLVQRWQGLIGHRARGNTGEDRYPLATVAGGQGAFSEAIAPAPWSRRVTPVEQIGTPEVILERLNATLRAGGCAAWVRNTVDDALAAAAMARAAGLDPIVFHARFAQADRQRIEHEVMRLFGPDSGFDDRRGKLVIATQVIEQSLDLDFDQIASDLAPIDLLLQRAGRMRRHAGRERPPGLEQTMLVLSPGPVADAGAEWLRPHLVGAGAVYRDHGVLWRTARELASRGRLAVPDDVRAMVEAVHSGDDCPPGLLLAADQADGEEKGAASLARNQLLDLGRGYSVDQPYQSELRVSTRNADAQTTIRLAKRNTAGAIVPWADRAGREWQAWALSEVRVRQPLAPLDSRSLPALAAELAPVIARWGRFEQDIPVCVLTEDGEGAWRGRIDSPERGAIVLRYDESMGLGIGGQCG
jgi:CRISPR-associated endonuclease/helicase Cas3